MSNSKIIATSDLPSCLKTEHIAEYLGVGRATAYNLVNSEGFPRVMVGRRIVVPKDAFLNWVETNTITSSTTA